MTGVATPRDHERGGALFAAVVDGASDAIIVTDLDGVIVHWNAAAAAGTGRGSDSTRGVKINGLGGPDHIGDIDALLAEVRDGRSARASEVSWTDGAGNSVDLDLAVSAVLDENGKPFQALFVIRDVSAERRATRELEVAHARLRIHSEHLAEANERLSKFANTLSHDLHQLLFAVGGYLELIADTDTLGPTERDLATRALASHRALVEAMDALRAEAMTEADALTPPA